MLKKLVFLPVFALTLFTAQPIMASTHSNCHCEKGVKNFKHLNLTDAQESKIKAIKDSTRDSMKANKDKLHQIRVQMHQLIIDDKIDEAKLNDLINQKAAILSSMMKTRLMAKN